MSAHPGAAFLRARAATRPRNFLNLAVLTASARLDCSLRRTALLIEKPNCRPRARFPSRFEIAAQERMSNDAILPSSSRKTKSSVSVGTCPWFRAATR